MKKVVNTTKLTIISFLFLVFAGGFLLNLPISNNLPHDFLNSLFTSTASVCVAGLATVVPAEQYTLFGKIVMLFLMQIGALGFIFVISTFFLIAKRKLSYKDKINIGTALGTPENLNNIKTLIKRVVIFTLVSELFRSYCTCI